MKPSVLISDQDDAGIKVCIRLLARIAKKWPKVRTDDLSKYKRRLASLTDDVFDELDLNWEKHVEFDATYMRPSEVDLLLGDPTKAKKQLGWEAKISFEQLVKIMVNHDLVLAKSEALSNIHKNPDEHDA